MQDLELVSDGATILRRFMVRGTGVVPPRGGMTCAALDPAALEGPGDGRDHRATYKLKPSSQNYEGPGPASRRSRSGPGPHDPS